MRVTSQPGPIFSNAQLAFAGVASLVLYVSFVFVQTVRHRDYFLPDNVELEDHAAPPSWTIALVSLGLLFECGNIILTICNCALIVINKKAKVSQWERCLLH